MAMKFGDISKMSVGEVVQGTATEGGAVVAGLFGAGFVGKQIENMLKSGVVAGSPMLDKLMAYGANNLPKLALYYLVRKEGDAYLKGMEKDVGKGMLASVVLDTAVRATHDFAPYPLLDFFGFNVMSGTGSTLSSSSSTPQMQANMQKVLQENSSLRQQLNSALQRVASASPNVTVTPVRTAQIPPPPPDHDRAYGMMQTTPEAEDRRRNYGAMTPPIEDERNRRYSQMNKPKMNFAGDIDSVAQQFGML